MLAAHGKSGLLRYISYPLICVLWDPPYLMVLFYVPLASPSPPPPSCGLCLSCSYFASFCSTAVSRKDRRETRGIRLSFHSGRNKRNSGKSPLPQRRVASPLSRPVSCFFFFSSSSSSFPSFYPRWLPRFYAVNSFSARMKEKLRGRRRPASKRGNFFTNICLLDLRSIYERFPGYTIVRGKIRLSRAI